MRWIRVRWAFDQYSADLHESRIGVEISLLGHQPGEKSSRDQYTIRGEVHPGDHVHDKLHID